LVSAYLYGSHAEERSHRESDVDVGILLRWDTCPAARDRFNVRVDVASWLAAELGGQPVDVVVLNDAPPHLGRHIVSAGVRVFCADPEADHAFVRDVQLRAADLEPFLRRARRIKLEALSG
jgi:predicted nucleotidyltransferase